MCENGSQTPIVPRYTDVINRLAFIHIDSHLEL
jgi:hypothetical protein